MNLLYDNRYEFDSDGIRRPRQYGLDLSDQIFKRSHQQAGISYDPSDYSHTLGQAAIIYVTGTSRDIGLTSTQCRALARALRDAADAQEQWDYELDVLRTSAEKLGYDLVKR